MSAGLQITGWPAHDSSISSIFFGPDETSIFSLGSDGKASTANLMLFLLVKWMPHFILIGSLLSDFRVEFAKSRSNLVVKRL